MFCLCATTAHAQVAPSATRRGLSITAGAFGSAFQPDYAGNGIAGTSPNRLYGIGAFVDFGLPRLPWVQGEAEGRWLRFNTYEGINEDNYLIGPRVPIVWLRWRRITPYGKFLVGYGRMNFENNLGSGHFTNLAPGAGLDIRVTDKLTVRIPDFEYQIWPTWVNNQTLKPYGGSVGVSYKIF